MKKIVILLFTLTNLAELLLLGYLFIIYSAYLHLFPWWYETDPIMLTVVFVLAIVFILIGAILCIFRTKLPILKTNAILPFCTIVYLVVTVFLVTQFRSFCIISGCIVIIFSFVLVIITTIITLKKMTVVANSY